MAKRAKGNGIDVDELQRINILLAQIEEFCDSFRPLDGHLPTGEAVDVFAEAVCAMIHRVGVRIDAHLDGRSMGWGSVRQRPGQGASHG